MAITLTGGSGLFDVFGAGLGVIGVGSSLTVPDANYYRSTSLVTKFNALDTAYAGMSGAGGRQSGAWTYPGLASMQTNVGSFLRTLGNNLSNTLIQMANDDTPLAALTAQNALTLLVQQMTANSNTVQASAPVAGAQTAVASPNGNPIITLSVLGPDGLKRQYLYPDTLTFTCTNDSQNGATLNQEPLSIVGKAAVADSYAATWPGGTGLSSTLTCVDATAANSPTGDLLSNSDFETWTGYPAAPDNWNILVGTAGTDITRGTSAYTGSYDLGFVGDASTLSSIAQTFGVAVSPLPGGTPQTLTAGGVYAVNFVVKASVVPAAGVLDVELVDSTNTVVNDANGVANRVRITLSAITTGYVAKTGFFRLPIPPTALPATIKLRVRLSTACSSGSTIHVDHLALTPATLLYTGGPYAAAFSMSTKLLKGDAWTVALTTTWGKFQQGFQRIFDMRALGLTLPNAASSPTIAESLIA